jgi:hypothetical protein
MMRTNNKPILLVLVIINIFGLLFAPRTLALSDDLIKQEIENEAADTLHLRGTRVDPVVEDGYVVLFGEVGLYIQKMFYEKIAGKNKGVIEVENEIRVVPRLRQTGAAVGRRITEVIKTHNRLKGAKPDPQGVLAAPSTLRPVSNSIVTAERPSLLLDEMNRISLTPAIRSSIISVIFVSTTFSDDLERLSCP